MAKVSHAALRALREIDHDFPARPTLPAAALCGGLAFVGRGAETPADLVPLRDTIEALWRGTLGAGADVRPLLLATFVRPVPLDDASWPSGLRLAPASAATLASYRRDIAPPADNFGSRGVRTLDLWWGGKPHRIAVGALEPVPLAILWMLPRLDVHRAHEPDERSTSFASGVAAASESATAATSTVTRAGAPVAADSSSQLKEMDKRLRAEAGRGGLGRGWFGGLFGPRLLGNGSNSGGRPGPWGQAPRRGPGPLSNLLGWLRWHSPLGEPLRRQFGDRLRQVERLIASGEMDAALKLALILGAGKRQEGQRTRYPNQLPRMRASLDFDVGDDTFTSPIFAEGDFIQLQSRYRSLADQLERDGDFRRAAYIHSQLLGDHKRAVLVLETGGMLDEAIKLAIHSRQDAVLIIRLLYQNGQLDAALAFAKRTACFDQLAEDSRHRNPAYHAYVVEAWTQQLLDTGQPFRALQVTDHITGIPDLEAARRGWLALALDDEGPHCFGGELAVRTLLMARWTGDDLSPEELADFPLIPSVDRSTGFAAAFEWVQSALRGEIQNSHEAMNGMLAALTRLAAPDREEQAAFWRGPCGPVLEAFARAMIEQTSDRLGQADLRALQALLEKARLPVLATDIQKLRKLEAAKPKLKRDWAVPPAEVIRPSVVSGCFLANGNMLVWRESQLLQLIDRHGATLWQKNVSNVSAMVAVGASPNVIILQDERNGVSRLTRFATHSRTFHPIGTVKLTAHHDITSESHWLVQIGGEIGALDLAKLCAAAPAIEFAWSCALTERLSAIAFGHHPGASSWLTRDLSPERFGIVESWSLLQSGQLNTSLCLPSGQGENDVALPPTTWCWTPAQGGLSTLQDGVRRAMYSFSWSDHNEERARLYAARQRSAGPEAVDRFQSCDLNRPFVHCRDDKGPAETFVGSLTPQQLGATLTSDTGITMSILARAVPGLSSPNQLHSPPAGLAMMADRFGRIFIVNAGDARVDVL